MITNFSFSKKNNNDTPKYVSIAKMSNLSIYSTKTHVLNIYNISSNNEQYNCIKLIIQQYYSNFVFKIDNKNLCDDLFYNNIKIVKDSNGCCTIYALCNKRSRVVSDVIFSDNENFIEPILYSEPSLDINFFSDKTLIYAVNNYDKKTPYNQVVIPYVSSNSNPNAFKFLTISFSKISSVDANYLFKLQDNGYNNGGIVSCDLLLRGKIRSDGSVFADIEISNPSNEVAKNAFDVKAVADKESKKIDFYIIQNKTWLILNLIPISWNFDDYRITSTIISNVVASQLPDSSNNITIFSSKHTLVNGLYSFLEYPDTTEKVDIIGMLNEIKTSANFSDDNIKKDSSSINLRNSMFSLEEAYKESNNNFTISEFSIQNNILQKDNTYLNWIESGDEVTNLSVLGRTLYKKGNSYTRFHKHAFEKNNIYESIGESEKTPENKYPIKLDIIDRDNNSQKITITTLLDEPLRSVYDFYDEIDFTNKILYRRIKEITLDDTYTVILKTKGTNYSSFYFNLKSKAISLDYNETRGSCISDSFYSLHLFYDLQVCRNEVEGIGISQDGNSVIIQIANAKLNTIDVAGMKSWIIANPVKLQYVLSRRIKENIVLDNDLDLILEQNRNLTIELQNSIKSFINMSVKKVINSKNTNYIDNYKNYNWNGKLKIENGEVVNQFGTPYQLTGLSTYNLNEKTNIATYNAIKTIKLYGANYLRIAIYLGNYNNTKGYLEDKDNIKSKVKELVEWGTDLGMYVCIDWHGLIDEKPMDMIEESKAFFTEMCTLYKDYPNIIYEIFNKPPIAEDTWINQMTPYANTIIPLIRSIIPDSLIIVGTQKACNIWEPTLTNPLLYDNILYSFHLYNGDFDYGNGLEYLACGLPIFISEWGVGELSTESQVSANYKKSKESIISRSKKFNISWAMKSLSSVDTCHNYVSFGTTKDGGWIRDELSNTGDFINNYFRYSK